MVRSRPVKASVPAHSKLRSSTISDEHCSTSLGFAVRDLIVATSTAGSASSSTVPSTAATAVAISTAKRSAASRQSTSSVAASLHNLASSSDERQIDSCSKSSCISENEPRKSLKVRKQKNVVVIPDVSKTDGVNSDNFDSSLPSLTALSAAASSPSGKNGAVAIGNVTSGAKPEPKRSSKSNKNAKDNNSSKFVDDSNIDDVGSAVSCLPGVTDCSSSRPSMTCITQGSILPTLAATKSSDKRRAAFASCTPKTNQVQSKKGNNSKVVKEIAGKSSTASDCNSSTGLSSTESIQAAIVVSVNMLTNIESQSSLNDVNEITVSAATVSSSCVPTMRVDSSASPESSREDPEDISSMYDKVKATKRVSSRVLTQNLPKDIVPIKKARRAGRSTLSELSNVTSEGLGKGKGKSSLLKNSKARLAQLRTTPVHDCYENVLKLVTRQSMGLHCNIGTKQSISKMMVSGLKEFILFKSTSPFDSRCTALDWHPINHNVLAVGAKYGNIMLWDIETPANDVLIPGRGPGGVQQGLKFVRESSTTSCRVVTASMDGTVSLRDLRVNSEEILMGDKAFYHEFWPCSVDVSSSGDTIVTGDSKGTVTLLTTSGEKAWGFRLHKSKVNHVELHPQNEWLLCTASTDTTVCLWDIRNIRDRSSCLETLVHNHGVASATFNQTDGQRLLTTDQHHELRVYQCGSWALERTLVQPHRHFQHLTPIRASWHPLQDIIVIGRYPDSKVTGSVVGEMRGVDMFDMTSTQPVCQLYDSNAKLIISLSKFNMSGSVLATTMGNTIHLWKRPDDFEANEMKLATDSIDGTQSPTYCSRAASGGMVEPRPRRGDVKMTKKLKSKLKD